MQNVNFNFWKIWKRIFHILKSWVKLTTLLEFMGCQILISRFEASVLIHCKIYAKDLCYSPFMLKIHSAWPILSWPNFTNIKYMFLLFCRIFTKQNKVVVNWGYTNVCFMMNDPLKMVLCHFCCFHYYNIKWLLSNILWKTTYFA